MHLLRLWFGFALPVDRRCYALSGFGLMALKYALEALVLYLRFGHVYTPLEFLQPFVGLKIEALRHEHDISVDLDDVYLWALGFNLPFLWIALSMTIRRAVDSGISAGWAVLTLVPYANFAVMLALATTPTAALARWDVRDVGAPSALGMRSALRGVLFGVAVAIVSVPVGMVLGGSYGLTLFALTPLFMGVSSSFAFNRPLPGSLWASIVVSQLAVLFTALAALLMSIEGLLCIAMALPVAAVAALFGAIIGHGIAVKPGIRPRPLLPGLVVLPLWSLVESSLPPPPLREVVTTVEVDAPPEVVWQHVVSFSELSDPPAWYFAAGIAYPVRAEIVGEGVGAVRHCVFSTGPFVEPITAWEPPHRLAFDVTAQPRPMRELSPWGDIAAPHLEGTLTSRRGEFRLVALAGGRTRLEGSTWYTLDMGPQAYWTLWSDALIRRIHGRVLRHVRDLSE